MAVKVKDELKIEYMNVEDIKVSPLNPAGRVSENAIKDLCREIQDSGRVLVPLQLTEDGFLADGHRRLECARRLGIKTVPVIHQKGFTNIDLWRSLNTGTRKMGSLDLFQAIIIYGAPIEAIPDYFRYPIEWIIDHLGMDLAREIAVKNLTPTGFQKVTAMIMRFCKRAEDDMFGQFVARWLIDNRQISAAKSAIEHHDITPEDLMDSIHNNLKLQRKWRPER